MLAKVIRTMGKYHGETCRGGCPWPALQAACTLLPGLVGTGAATLCCPALTSVSPWNLPGHPRREAGSAAAPVATACPGQPVFAGQGTSLHLYLSLPINVTLRCSGRLSMTHSTITAEREAGKLRETCLEDCEGQNTVQERGEVGAQTQS